MKKSESRTTNSRNNLITSFVGQILVIVMSLVCRTVFIRTLGKAYLGVNGLFANIITLLNLTELGIGTAIVFNLYKPIAEKDEDRIYVLMKFYKQAYFVIGLIVVALGLILVPFLPSLVKKVPSFINMYFIYGLYLAQSASSYFFYAYKSSIIHANQQAYIINTIDWWFTLGINAAQMLVLWLWRDFEVFVALEIFSNIAKNLYIGKISDKLYPYINKKSDNKLSWIETKQIMKDCYALSLWKINNVISASIDSICLVYVSGFDTVGLYSNFQVLRNNISRLLNTFYVSITASVGNLNAVENEKNIEIYRISNFITAVLYGIVSLGFIFVANPFVVIWAGNDFKATTLAVTLWGVDMYIIGISKLNGTFRSALGLFEYMKYRPLFGAVLNIVISIWLAYPLGISGVIIGTIICNFILYFWLEPLIVYKNGFKHTPVEFYITNFIYIIILAGIGTLINSIMNCLNLNVWLHILLSGSLSVVLPILVFSLIYWKSKEMEYLRKKLIMGKLRNR